MRVTVIIPTLNRADQLRRLSLDSLAKQDTNNFDLIISDASTNDLTMRVCEEYPRQLYYYHAPRIGLTKQRNDAINKARELFPQNEIILFLDDDILLSENAVSGIISTFQNNQISGVGIPLKGDPIVDSFIKRIIKALFLNFVFDKRHMTSYCYCFQLNQETNSCHVNWLSGCCMAFLTSCFEQYHFDEELCKYGGYCLAEDAIFSALLFVNGHRFMLSDEGCAKHIRDGTNRLDYKSMVSSFLYNKKRLFNTLNSRKTFFYRSFNFLLYFWNMSYILSHLLIKALKDHQTSNFFNGFYQYIFDK